MSLRDLLNNILVNPFWDNLNNFFIFAILSESTWYPSSELIGGSY